MTVAVAPVTDPVIISLGANEPTPIADRLKV